MNSVSDAEATADFASVLTKHLRDKLLDTVAARSKVVSAAKKVVDSLVEESKRAEKAREGRLLKDFLVRFSRSLAERKVNLSASKGDFFALVRSTSERMSQADRNAYRKTLADYADRLDRLRTDGWLTGHSMFKLLAFEWINDSKKAFLRPDNVQRSLVRIWVDRHDKVTKARINAPGGQQIAEQLLKDAAIAGLRPYEWPVRRMVLFFGKNDDWPEAISRLTAGRPRCHVTRSARQRTGRESPVQAPAVVSPGYKRRKGRVTPQRGLLPRHCDSRPLI